jgi:heme/copper-type cytochrome/quinol oxidase subunit 2
VDPSIVAAAASEADVSISMLVLVAVVFAIACRVAWQHWRLRRRQHDPAMSQQWLSDHERRAGVDH